MKHFFFASFGCAMVALASGCASSAPPEPVAVAAAPVAAKSSVIVTIAGTRADTDELVAMLRDLFAAQSVHALLQQVDAPDAHPAALARAERVRAHLTIDLRSEQEALVSAVQTTSETPVFVRKVARDGSRDIEREEIAQIVRVAVDGLLIDR